MTGEVAFQMGIKALVRNPEGQILVLEAEGRTHSAGIDSYWDIPGGRIAWEDVMRESGSARPDWDATCEAVLRREIEEETGLREVRIGEALSIVPANFPEFPDRTGAKVFLLLRPYICHVAGTPVLRLSEEHRAARWASPAEAALLLAIKWPPAFTEQVNKLGR